MGSSCILLGVDGCNQRNPAWWKIAGWTGRRNFCMLPFGKVPVHLQVYAHSITSMVFSSNIIHYQCEIFELRY